MSEPAAASRAVASIARQLVLFCDGTNNTLTGGQRDTHVLRLFERLAVAPDAQRLMYYDPGVGAPDGLPVDGMDWLMRKWRRMSGLAYGQGIYDNIAQGYGFLMQHWRPGDEIWLFGFSRGAFTARSISGMVNLFGVVRAEHVALLQTLLRVYFAPAGEGRQWQIDKSRSRQQITENVLGIEAEPASARSRSDIAAQVKASFAGRAGAAACAHFVGVWDTVESVGLPGLRVRISSTPSIEGKAICHVRHALSLDEHRFTFKPRLYADANHGGPSDAQSLRQLWFRGVHADVGGGYAPEQSGLGKASFDWMLGEARACGLRVPADDAAPVLPEDAARKLHDETYAVPWWAAAGLCVRELHPPGAPPAQLHASALRTQPPLTTVWSRRRSWTAPLLALALGVVTLLLQGSILDAGRAATGLADWGRYLRLALFDVPALQCALLGARGNTLAALWAQLPGHGGLAVFALGLLFMACYAYLLSRVVSWAFARCAGLRHADRPRRAWRLLGLALLVMVLADAARITLAWVAWGWVGPLGALQELLLRLVGAAALLALLGLAGCIVLAVMGLFARPGPPFAPVATWTPPSPRS